MTEKTFELILTLGRNSAFLIWFLLAVFILIHLLKGNRNGLMITCLYAINSITFMLAYRLMMNVALAVMLPICTTKEESIRMLLDIHNQFLSNAAVSILILVGILSIVNIVYLKYYVKTNPLKHSLILGMSDLVLLVCATYISSSWYYNHTLEGLSNYFGY